MDEKKVLRVFSLANELFEKRADYVVLDFTLGFNNEKNKYERWNIYTPHIRHNIFTSLSQVIDFMEKLVLDDVFYNSRSIEKLKDNLLDAERRYANAKDDIKRLEEEINAAQKFS